MSEKLKYLAIGRIPALVESLTGISYSRINIYRWIKDGRINQQGSRERLKTVRKLGRLYTTQEWLENFMRSIG